jgi:uncharacterized alpha/beta hydrolase family protein
MKNKRLNIKRSKIKFVVVILFFLILCYQTFNYRINTYATEDVNFQGYISSQEIKTNNSSNQKDIPQVYITTVSGAAINTEYSVATVTVKDGIKDNVIVANARIKVRGNTTSTAPKSHIKLSLIVNKMY